MLQRFRDKTDIKGQFTYLQVILILAIMLFSAFFIRKTRSTTANSKDISENQVFYSVYDPQQTDTGF
jgi:predicted RND superfamily exporter protein